MRTLLNFQRIYQAYRKHTDADPQAPENVQMVNMTIIGQSTLGIRKKLQRLDGALGMIPSQLVDGTLKVYNAWEARKIKLTTVLLEAGWGGQRRNQDPSCCSVTVTIIFFILFSIGQM